MARLDEARARELIARPGVPAGTTSGPGAAVDKYNGMADPAGAEELGSELAARLRDRAPDAVVVWEDPEDVVLGHVVARELGISMVRAYDADGLVGTNGNLPPDPRIALVADAVRDPRVVRAARALAGREGGSLVATAVLVDSAALEAVVTEAGEVIALTPRPGDDGTAAAGTAAADAGAR